MTAQCLVATLTRAALLLYWRSLPILEKALDPGHSAFAHSIGSLALLYTYQGRYADAEPLCQRSLAISEKALGPGHPDVTLSLTLQRAGPLCRCVPLVGSCSNLVGSAHRTPRAVVYSTARPSLSSGTHSLTSR
jgi:hypothetical protein